MDTKGITTSPLVPNLGTDKADRSQRAKKKNDLLVDPGKSGVVDANSAKAGNYGVNVSSQARELAQARMKAMDIARNTPDIREDKVAALKKRIAEGNYEINAEGIADGMMREAVRDELALNMHNEAKDRE